MQFVPYDEKVEVIGAAVLATLDGMGVAGRLQGDF